MMTDLSKLSWPAAQLGEALNALARRSGLAAAAVELPNSGQVSGQCIEATAKRLGLEAEEVGALYGEVERMLVMAGPALLRVPGEESFLVLLGGGRGKVALLAPDLIVRRIRVAELRGLLCHRYEEPLRGEVDELLLQIGVAGVARRHLATARAALLRERLSQVWLNECWLLRLTPGADFVKQLRQARLPRSLGVLAATYTLQFALGLLAWWVLGRGLLGGSLDRGWLLAWALLLLTAAAFRLLAVRAQGRFAIGAGSLLKQRLLCGALRLEPEEIRHEGVGQLLGRVIEANAVESLTLNGGFLGVVAMIELSAAALLLSAGAGGWLHVLLLLSWLTLALGLGWLHWRRRGAWTQARLELTNDLIERMVGHRTRLAQEAPARWHDDEDQALERYLAQATTLDRASLLQAVLARGWLLVALLGLSPAFVSGVASPAALAISLGGILLAYRALAKLSASLSSLLSAAIAWRQVAPLIKAAARTEEAGAWLAEVSGVTPPSAAVMEAHELAFRYREHGDAVLRGCSLRIAAGDKLLLEGASGGGKSTLTALLAGLRVPQGGLLLAGGLDYQTLGARGWRRRVVAAPQFHENHVFTGTFAFNLLMGRNWPPRAQDFAEAEALCRQLGLGELLERMPAGLLQMVGETGWQLSHGERSRLFLARALLQKSELVILDESFAALDPATLSLCLQTALNRAQTLLVIAHP